MLEGACSYAVAADQPRCSSSLQQVSSGSCELQRGTGELGMHCQAGRAGALSGAAQSDGAGLGAELLSRYGSPWKPGAPIP